MKIFTFFESLNSHKEKEQLEMIRLWEISWKKNGFEPIVLNKKDAETSNIYNKFVNLIKKSHVNIIGREINEYSLACFTRWIAYANQKIEQHFLVSDYDVVNKNLKPERILENKSKLSFLDDFCPSLAYGNSTLIENFCRDVANTISQNEFLIKKVLNYLGIKSFHDQDFLFSIYNIYENPSLGINSSIKNFCEKINIAKNPYARLYELDKRDEMKKYHVFHVAHRSAHEARLKYSFIKEKDYNYIRILLMNLVLLESEPDL